MNERVKELFIQLFGKNNFPKGNAEVYMSAEDLKEFAELLVKECMEQVWYSREDGINGNISQVIKDRIKEHFGVKE